MGIHRLTFVLPTPAITVVIPYYNEQESLRYLLDQLAAQTLAPREVILVNSSSTDGSSALIDEWISSHVTETVFRNLNASTTTPGGSKTAGVNVATGELLAFMDCDLTFPTEWLQRQAEVLASTGADWVSGVCRTRGTTIIDRAAIAHTYGYMNTRPVIPSSLVRRSVFERIGMFKDLRAGYDVEWARASSRAGLRREINHHVVVEYRGVNFAKDLRSVFEVDSLRQTIGRARRHRRALRIRFGCAWGSADRRTRAVASHCGSGLIRDWPAGNRVAQEFCRHHFPCFTDTSSSADRRRCSNGLRQTMWLRVGNLHSLRPPADSRKVSSAVKECGSPGHHSFSESGSMNV